MPTDSVVTNAAARMPTADEIFGRPPAPVLWPATRPVLEIAIEVLPMITDDVTTDLIEHLAVLLVDCDEALHVTRELLSGALAMTHAQHVVIIRLQARLARLLDEFRSSLMQTLQART